MNIFRVKDWDKHFENNKSRERDNCHFVCVPNKQHGLGLTRILSEPDGAAIYGIWHLIIGMLSRQSLPRRGYLTEDGTEDGRPLCIADLAMMWRRDQAEISRAIDVLTSRKVGWIEAISIECPEGAFDVPEECPSSALEENGREGNGKKDSSEVPKAAPSEPPFMIFPTNGRIKEWGLPNSKFEEYQGSYPGVDVLAELRQALQWCRDNPRKRKTADGMASFLTRWMGRAQNRSRTNGAREPPSIDGSQWNHLRPKVAPKENPESEIVMQ